MSTEHMNSDRRVNRCAVFRIGYNRLLDAIQLLTRPADTTSVHVVRWTKTPWPEGARCVQVREDPWSRSFLLTFEHESFPETPEGAPFPILNDGLPAEPEFEMVEYTRAE